MLSLEEDVEAIALHKQGWKISAIARHLGRDRKTVRAYITGKRVAGRRRPRTTTTRATPFEAYVAVRLKEDPHVWATALLDELRQLGYSGSYQRLTALIRERGLRPHCEACSGTKGRPTIAIAHPPGKEIQWDIVDLSGAPWTEETVHVLVGSLAHSGRTRAVILESQKEGHVVAAIDAILRKLGGTAHSWRFDRMAVVCDPKTGVVWPRFTSVARHYGVTVAICPPRHGNRKGVVEKRNHVIAQRWWRTADDVATVALAQLSLDTFLSGIAETFERHGSTVAEVAAAERLLPVAALPYPVVVADDRRVDPQALVWWDGNHYAVPPEMVGAMVNVQQQLGTPYLTVMTGTGHELVRHRVAAGSGQVVRSAKQFRALEAVVLANFNTAKPCRRKDNKPPGPAAQAAAAALRAAAGDSADVHVDLGAYALAAGA